METKTKPEPAAGKEKETAENPRKAIVEIGYDTETNTIQIRAKMPNVMLTSILKLAEMEKSAIISIPPPAGPVRTVTIEYDIEYDTANVESDASDMLRRGIIGMAQSTITTSQVLKSVQAMQSKSRIVGPDGGKVS